METSNEEFVGERITPVPGTADASAMARGEPGLPGRFVWHDTEYRVAGVIQTWKTSGPCRNGSDEIYLRRHWFKIVVQSDTQSQEDGDQSAGITAKRQAGSIVMTIYFDRQARNRKKPTDRWWLYSWSPGATNL